MAGTHGMEHFTAKKKKKRKILKHVMNCRKKFSNLSFPLMML